MLQVDAMLNKAKQIVIDYFNNHCEKTDGFVLTKDDVFYCLV